jgi:hypothetical protein
MLVLMDYLILTVVLLNCAGALWFSHAGKFRDGIYCCAVALTLLTVLCLRG